MARLDQVITNIVDIFIEYADDGGKKRQLNKEELKKLFEQEIQNPELKVKQLDKEEIMCNIICAHLLVVHVTV